MPLTVPSSFFRYVAAAAGRALSDLVAPELCAACDEPIPALLVFCTGCEPEPTRVPTEALPGGGHLVAARPYVGPAGQAIRRLKFGGRPDLARPLGRLTAEALARAALPPVDLLVPVPLHAGRLAERGYNQAALIALHASAGLGVRAAPRALGRRKVTREQATLDRADRLANVTGAFAARVDLRGLRVVLVDDVVTTGATAYACVAALRGAGAEVLAIACVARAEGSAHGGSGGSGGGGDRRRLSRPIAPGPGA